MRVAVLPDKAEDILPVAGHKQTWKQSGGIAGKAWIEGAFKGDLHARSVLVGKTGLVVGNAYADRAIISGRVEGSICARSVNLLSTSIVRGMIVTRTLEIESGADFQGKSRSLAGLLA